MPTCMTEEIEVFMVLGENEKGSSFLKEPVVSDKVFFFFSSRRRHTRSKRDWSSDVCSSDLRRRAGRSGGLHCGARASSGRIRLDLLDDAAARRPQDQRGGEDREGDERSGDDVRSEERRVGKEWRFRWRTEC